MPSSSAYSGSMSRLSPAPTTAFLDANVLAKPVTRSLVIFAGEDSGYVTTWSAYVEAEADAHLGPRKAPLTVVRTKAGMDLSPRGADAQRFSGTAAPDRQVLADAAAAGAAFLVTEDVDDFDPSDLDTVGIAAVNPDLFLAERASRAGYEVAVRFMASAMRDPSRTPEELHARIGRQHPLTVVAHADVFDVSPLPPPSSPPAVIFRGHRCLRCTETGTIGDHGLCEMCATGR